MLSPSTKVGDPVVFNVSWTANYVRTVSGAYSNVGIVKGELGTITMLPGGAPLASLAYVVKVHSSGEEVVILGQWMDPSPTPSGFYREGDALKFTVYPGQPVGSIKCTCDINTIMGKGCVCGHVKRYVPPSERGAK